MASHLPVWLRTVAAFVAFSVVLAFLGLRVVNHFPTPEQRVLEDWGLMDFLDGSYYPVVAFLDGVNPYDSQPYRASYPVQVDYSPYSPATLILHLPFGLLPVKVASVVFFVFNVLLLLALASTLLCVCGLDIQVWRVFALATALLLTRPGHLVILGGQIVYEVTIGTIIALHFARRKPWLAGIGLALATLKPTFGVPLVILMLLRRDRQAVTIGVVAAVTSACVGTLVVAANTGGLPSFVRVIWDQYLRSGGVPGVPELTAPMRLDAVSVVARLTGHSPGIAFEFLVLTAVIAVSGIGLRRLTDRAPHDGAAGISAAIISLTMMTCVYHMLYDATLLALPFLAALAARGSSWSNIAMSGRLTLTAVLGVVLLNYLMTNTAIRILDLQGAALVGVIASHGIAILTALAMCLFWAFRCSLKDTGRPG